MSEPHLQPDPRRESFEQQDLSVKGIFYFMVGLAVVIALVYGIVGGMFQILESTDKKRQEPVSPMAVKTGVDPRSMPFPVVEEKIDQSFPKPVLEHSERQQFEGIVQEQDKVLASYDWVDQKNGVVRIPIDQAMELLAQRGLPVRPEGGVAQPSSPTGKPKVPTKETSPTR